MIANLKRRAGVAWRRHRWALAPLAVLVYLRWLFLHNDPTDFAQDRNFVMAMLESDKIGAHSIVHGFWKGLPAIAAAPDWLPEFPFAGIFAWMLAPHGVPVVLAGRMLGLIASILTGWGLYRLGRRMGGLRLGLWALWLFALIPMSVFMGRNILPDTPMVAGVVWMFCAAGAGCDRRRLGRRMGDMHAAPTIKSGVWKAFWFSTAVLFTGLAKLTGVWFAPAAALAWMQAQGWGRVRSWAGLALAAILGLHIVGGWYHVGPLAPVHDVHAVSDHTSHFMTPLGQMLNMDFARVTLARLLLAMTFPGVALALIGALLICFASNLSGGRRGFLMRVGRHGWLLAWAALAVLFVWMTVKANAYWAYVATPAGVLLAAVALDAAARRGWLTLAAAFAAVIVALFWDPSLDRVGQFLAIQPAYAEAAGAAGLSPASSRLLFHGVIPGDLAFMAMRDAKSYDPAAAEAWRARLNAGDFDYFLDLNQGAAGLDAALFQARPVIYTRGTSYIEFATSKTAGLGSKAAAGPMANDLDVELGGELTVLGFRVMHPARLQPGGSIDLEVKYARGLNASATPPNVALTAVHNPGAIEIPLEPISGGARLPPWELPMIQTPDFREGPIATMDYRLRFPKAMPAGDYALRWLLLAGPGSASVRARAGMTSTWLSVGQADFGEQPGRLLHDLSFGWLGDLSRWRYDPFDAAWLGLQETLGPAWQGKANRHALLAAGGSCWLGHPGEAGDYELSIAGRGIPAGDDPRERWPRLRLTLGHAGADPPALLTFDSRYAMTVQTRIHWGGRSDMLNLMLDNPYVTPVERPALPIFLDERRVESRSIELDSIEWQKVK